MLNMQKIVKALDVLVPNAKFLLNKEENVIGEWLDNRAQPSDKQIEAKIKELDAEAKIQAKYDSCTNYIYKHYPQTKQNSDLADKLYCENTLKAGGFKDLEQAIVSKVVEFEGGKSLDELLSDVADEHKRAIEQLLKVGIRVSWVQKCKEELKKAIAEDREPNYPKYPL